MRPSLKRKQCVKIDCNLKLMKIMIMTMKIMLNNGLQVTTIATTTGPLSDVYFPSVIVCSINQIRKSLFRVSSFHPFSKYCYSVIAHTKTKVKKNYNKNARKSTQRCARYTCKIGKMLKNSSELFKLYKISHTLKL